MNRQRRHVAERDNALLQRIIEQAEGCEWHETASLEFQYLIDVFSVSFSENESV